jgi:flagellar hook-associated protein 2
MSTTTSSTSVFSGNSRYATDLQSVIDRSVAIASLPLSQLNNQKTELTDRSTALDALDGRFSALQDSLSAVEESLGTASFDAEVSNTAALSATVGEGALEGTYSVKVISLGSYTTTLGSVPDGTTLKNVSDPSRTGPTADTTFTLTVDGRSHTINLTNTSLSALAAAINADSDADVRATVVNVSSGDTPDYRLSVQSNKLGPVAITLKAGATSLLDEQTRGAKATYNVNGARIGAEEQIASSDSRTVQIAPGLTVDLLATTAAAVDITVTRRSSAVSDALSGFVAAYNAAVDEVDKHRGQAGGALSGQGIISTLSQTLSQLTGYTASGSVTCLKDAGLSFDQTGHLEFNSLAFIATDFKYAGGVAAFLGSTTTGGFLKSASDALDVIEHPASGSLQVEMNSVQTQISGTDSRIATQQTYVDNLRERLNGQMAAADAVIAGMEQQYEYISAMFDSMLSASKD